MKYLLISASFISLIIMLIELTLMSIKKKELPAIYSVFIFIWTLFLLTTEYSIVGIYIIAKNSLMLFLGFILEDEVALQKLRMIRRLFWVFDIIVTSILISILFH